MKKAKVTDVADMRAEYRKADFPSGLVRGKYAARLSADANIVILEPEIAAAFPTSRAVNEALGIVLQAARAARLAKPPAGEKRSRAVTRRR
jgi:septum formation inhibitor-activating ATPase MinD